MTSDEALADIRGYAKYGRYRFLLHARNQARDRGFSLGEIVDGLSRAEACQRESDERWRATCRDRCGDLFDAIVEIEDELIIVTVFAR